MTLEQKNEQLIESCLRRDIKTTLRLLKEGADIYDRGKDGGGALHTACRRGYMKIATLLIDEQMVSVNRRDYFKRIPLHTAAIAGQIEITELLLKKGTWINAKDLTGHTPLCYASRMGHTEIVTLLKKAAAK